ncbi:MAG: T9SS type A sorting domain-containing protein [Chitinophagaceae bacterium]|nr:T9SS type A sorting domain-containing protein [Chitinophagaceae bacterium]
MKTEKAGFVQRNYEISIDKLTPGSYILHITTGNEKYTIKFVKE